MPDRTDGSSFFEVFVEEADVINARRHAVAEGRLAADRGHYLNPPAQVTKPIFVQVDERKVQTPRGRVPKPDERGRRVPRPAAGHKLTGLALSGGGVRSAAFCLGILQGLDALKEDHEPQVLDQIDYLSTVSGGGYIGTALVSGLMQAQGGFPFTSKLDQEETIETQHLRDFSNYLIPRGIIDVFIGVAAVVRGLLVNGLIFLGILLLLAAMTVWFEPTIKHLNRPILVGDQFAGHLFFWTMVAAAVWFLLQPITTIFSRQGDLQRRERSRFGLALAFICVLLLGLIEAQPYVLKGIFEAYHGKDLALAANDNIVARLLYWFGEKLPTLWTALLPAAVALAGSASKLAAVAQARHGDRTWNGSIKRWLSVLTLYISAAVIPLLLWSVYLLLSYWGIAFGEEAGHAHTPRWLSWLSGRIWSPHEIAECYVFIGLVILIISVFVRPNAGSLHGYYRDRLSQAFLWQRSSLMQNARTTHKPVKEGFDVDRFRFSSLKKMLNGEWADDVRFAPYLLVNTAVNLGASSYLNRRGRNADSFIFSPLFIGSEATGYVPSQCLEALDKGMNLGTAMAVSGAAASANMGASTIKPLIFSLAALNVRLGYWVPNPRYIEAWKGRPPWLTRVGPIYFALETFGLLSERTKNVYLTDGGHFDNLGIYELLKRRCRLIIAVDAEADPQMNFASFVRLQRYARIDLGVRIDLPWDVLRRRTLATTSDPPQGSEEAARCCGPHVAVGHIEYGEHESGVLIYLKSSLSGDESDIIRDYKRRYAEFPHETTLDQFFSEEQFEVYRALGFHVAKGFFTGRDSFGSLLAADHDGWLEHLEETLEYLNVPAPAKGKILERASQPTWRTPSRVLPDGDRHDSDEKGEDEAGAASVEKGIEVEVGEACAH